MQRMMFRYVADDGNFGTLLAHPCLRISVIFRNYSKAESHLYSHRSTKYSAPL